MKKKILIANDMLKGGGVEKLMWDLVWHWHEKYDITILTYIYCEGMEELYPPDVQYLHTTYDLEYVDSRMIRLYNKLRRKVYNRVFAWKFKRMHFDLAIALKDGMTLLRVSEMNIPKKYAWVHTDYNHYYYTREMFNGPDNERRCMQKFDGIVCVAEDIRKGIVDVIGDPGNLMVRYNPIDTAHILACAKEPVVDISPVPENGVTRFVTAGRLNYQKGYDLLLEACHMLEKDGLKFEVLIVGAQEPWGDEHWRLYRAQKRLGLTSVKFLGGRKNPYKYMKCADWFLSTSVFEGYSLVSQEAAVLDIPLILTDCSGVRELLGDSEYGIVMGISVLDIYENMKRVIEQPRLHEYYKEKIMERKSVINFDQRLKAIEELLE